MSYIFLDESGQFSKDGPNNYFLLASFTIANPRASYNGFRAYLRAKMPRIMRNLPEIKFADAKIGDKLLLKTLDTIASLGVQIRYSYLHKNNIPEEFRYKGILKDGYLYAHIVSETIKGYLPMSDRELRIYCDERHLKGFSTKKFKNDMETHLLPLMPKGSLVEVNMVVSHNNPNIQIADWIAGALARYHNGKHLGKACYDTLKGNLLDEGKELFEDLWISKAKQNKKPDF